MKTIIALLMLLPILAFAKLGDWSQDK